MLRQVLLPLVAAAAMLSVGNTGLADVVTDYSGNNNHAESYGDVLNVGDLNQSLVFDGDADYIGTPGFSNPMNAFTIAAWVQFNDDGEAGWDNTMFGNPNWKAGSIRTEIYNGGEMRSAVRTNAEVRADVGLGFNPAVGQWYHVAQSFGIASATPDKNIVTLALTDIYGNSTIVSRDYANTESFDLSTFNFAGIEIEGRYLYGQMTDMRVYGEGLSNADIALLSDHDLGTNPSATNLLANYHPTLAGIPAPATNSVVYREIFPNDAGVDGALSEAGWQIHKTGGLADGNPILSYVAGSYANAQPVNSNPANAELDRGFAISLDGETGVSYLYWSDEQTIDRDNQDIGNVSWCQKNNSTDDQVRVAVQIADGNWFVSEEMFANSVGGIWEPKSLDFGSSGWLSLAFLPNVSLNLGAAATLDAGDITAFGLFVDELHTGRDRFDSFTISLDDGSVIDAIPGDANNDGKVDAIDAAALASNWLKATGATWGQGDFNDDGAVNDIDATILATNWQSGTAAGVPEPGTLALLASMLLCVVISRRRIR